MRSPTAARGRYTILTASALALALALGTGTAHAGYSISSNALSAASGWGCNVTYNQGNTGSYNGYSQYACAKSGASTGGVTVVYSGTKDKTGLAKSTSQTSTSQVDAGGGYATSRTYANLKTAKVSLSTKSSGSGSGISSATISDTLHFQIAGANASTVTYIPVSFKFAGKLITSGLQGFSDSAYLFWGFSFGGGSTYEYGDYGAGYYNGKNQPIFAFPETTPSRTSGWQSFSFASYKPTDTRFSATYAVTGATADIPISFALGLQESGNVALSYPSTGSVTVGQLPGVTYTSDSGVFGNPHIAQSARTSSVPEPANMILFGLAVGAAGLAAGNRRRG